MNEPNHSQGDRTNALDESEDLETPKTHAHYTIESIQIRKMIR